MSELLMLSIFCLVAFLMYQVYMLIKGTIATYIFITIITFYVVWLLVKDNMLLLGSILGQIIGVGAIALIVVFQQELRRFLIMFSVRYFPKAGISIDNFFSKIGTGIAGYEYQRHHQSLCKYVKRSGGGFDCSAAKFYA